MKLEIVLSVQQRGSQRIVEQLAAERGRDDHVILTVDLLSLAVEHNRGVLNQRVARSGNHHHDKDGAYSETRIAFMPRHLLLGVVKVELDSRRSAHDVDMHKKSSGFSFEVTFQGQSDAFNVTTVDLLLTFVLYYFVQTVYS